MGKRQIFSVGPMILVGFLVLVESLVQSGAVWVTQDSKTYEYNRTSFPSEFIFGAASAAYQNEGAFNEGGKGTSIWDTFTHKFPDKITDHNSGDVAVDSYHRYKEDVQILKNMEMDGYRFSISWPRLLPNGKLSGGVNKEGIQYYNNLINELLSKGVKPFVTIFHWDLPQPLQDEYGGFLSPRIVDDFKDFAELCFKEFGDRVKHWITINEPWTFIFGGYTRGVMAPGRCSKFLNCPQGDSATEPYIVGHHMLLAHAAAAKVYKGKYQASQKGKIGITLNTDWMVPHSETKSDREAALRSLDFSFGWFLRPLTHGHYPVTMRYLVKDRLPNFTRYQSLLVRGSIDFLGLNYYCSSYATDIPQKYSANPTYLSDSYVNITYDRNGILIGPQAGSFWLHVYPKGIKDLLVHIKKRYSNLDIYITENGYSDVNDPKITLQEALKDDARVDYYKSHLFNVQQAIKEGVQVKGYFAWTLVDNYEWSSGYSVRFGLNYVDRNDGLKRYPKASAVWFKNFLQHKI